jgi:hypothetical protein
MDQSVFDTENRLRKAGFSPEVIETATALRKRLYAKVRAGRYDDKLIADIEKLHDESWFKPSGLPYPVPASEPEGERRFLRFEPVPTWERVRVPVLALWGEDDQSVPAAKSRELLDRALSKAKNPDVTLETFPCADHTLSVVHSASDAWDFPRAAAGSREVMAAWLLAHRDHDLPKRSVETVGRPHRAEPHPLLDPPPRCLGHAGSRLPALRVGRVTVLRVRRQTRTRDGRRQRAGWVLPLRPPPDRPRRRSRGDPSRRRFDVR